MKLGYNESEYKYVEVICEVVVFFSFGSFVFKSTKGGHYFSTLLLAMLASFLTFKVKVTKMFFSMDKMKLILK